MANCGYLKGVKKAAGYRPKRDAPTFRSALLLPQGAEGKQAFGVRESFIKEKVIFLELGSLSLLIGPQLRARLLEYVGLC